LAAKDRAGRPGGQGIDDLPQIRACLALDRGSDVLDDQHRRAVLRCDRHEFGTVTRTAVAVRALDDRLGCAALAAQRVVERHAGGPNTAVMRLPRSSSTLASLRSAAGDWRSAGGSAPTMMRRIGCR
jgi:hypothetical protein